LECLLLSELLGTTPCLLVPASVLDLLLPELIGFPTMDFILSGVIASSMAARSVATWAA